MDVEREVKLFKESLVNKDPKIHVAKKRWPKAGKLFGDLYELAKDFIVNETNLDINKKGMLEDRATKLAKYFFYYDIRNMEQAKTDVPMCKYCGGKHVVPEAAKRYDINKIPLLSEHCGSLECKHKYQAEKRKTKLIEKYGTYNIHEVPELKKRHDDAVRKAYSEHNDEITKKRIKTTKEKYGVDNVSRLNEVKMKKGQTFTEHYGVDNIFKRPDLMKKFWKEKLGVTNPALDEEILMKFFRGSNKIVQVEVGNRKFLVADKFEYDMIKIIYKLDAGKQVFYRLKVNEVPYIISNNGKDLGYIPDITFDHSNIVFELKRSFSKIERDVKAFIASKQHKLTLYYFVQYANSLQSLIMFYVSDGQILRVLSNFKRKPRAIENLLKNVKETVEHYAGYNPVSKDVEISLKDTFAKDFYELLLDDLNINDLF